MGLSFTLCDKLKILQWTKTNSSLLLSKLQLNNLTIYETNIWAELWTAPG